MYSEKCIKLVKSFEGCVLTAYRCAAGVYTIGYGHTKDVRKGNKITQDKADALLLEDLNNAYTKVKKYEGKYTWTQNQVDALTSFTFNVGNIDGLTKNGTRTNSEIADAILLYNKAGGKTLAGLCQRRQEERNLFVDGINIKTLAEHRQLNYQVGKNYIFETTMNIRTKPKEVNGKLVLGKKLGIGYTGLIIENIATMRLLDNIFMCVAIDDKEHWVLADDGERCYINECTN